MFLPPPESSPAGVASDRLGWLLHPDRPAWLRAGVRSWLATTDPLHACLALSRAEAARALRDAHLAAAWHTLPGPAGWRRAVALAAEIRKFESRAWPRLGDLAAPDPDWSALRRALWLAFTAAGEAGVPQTPEMIAKIVKSAGVYISDDRIDTKKTRKVRRKP